MRAPVKFLALMILAAFFQEGKIAYSELHGAAGWRKIQEQQSSSAALEYTMLNEKTLVGVFAGAYNIADDRFKQIYEGQAYVFGFGLSQRIHAFHRHFIFISLDFKFYTKKGKSTVTKEDAKLILKPISLGGVYMFLTKPVIPFAEIGGDYYPYQEESPLYTTSGSALGFHVQTGVLIPLKVIESLKVKLYLRYSRVKTEENDLEVNLGGIEYGLGLVYGLNLF